MVWASPGPSASRPSSTCAPPWRRTCFNSTRCHWGCRPPQRRSGLADGMAMAMVMGMVWDEDDDDEAGGGGGDDDYAAGALRGNITPQACGWILRLLRVASFAVPFCFLRQHFAVIFLVILMGFRAGGCTFLRLLFSFAIFAFWRTCLSRCRLFGALLESKRGRSRVYIYIRRSGLLRASDSGVFSRFAFCFFGFGVVQRGFRLVSLICVGSPCLSWSASPVVADWFAVAEAKAGKVRSFLLKKTPEIKPQNDLHKRLLWSIFFSLTSLVPTSSLIHTVPHHPSTPHQLTSSTHIYIYIYIHLQPSSLGTSYGHDFEEKRQMSTNLAPTWPQFPQKSVTETPVQQFTHVILS